MGVSGFWHLYQLKFEEISPKIPRMQILRKLSPLAPLGIKNFFGRLLASISAQVWRNITKNTKNADFKKTGPPAAPVYSPPCPPWKSRKFWGGFWHLVGSNPSHLAQKISQNHQFWSNRCMTPFVGALCNVCLFHLTFGHLGYLESPHGRFFTVVSGTPSAPNYYCSQNKGEFDIIFASFHTTFKCLVRVRPYSPWLILGFQDVFAYRCCSMNPGTIL